MNRQTESHFESIESAREFVDLLSQTVHEVKKEIDADLQKALESQSFRQLDALRTVSYNLEKLAKQMKKSCRILNDLRILRRLLCGERDGARPLSSAPPKVWKADVPFLQAGHKDANDRGSQIEAD